MNYLKTLWAFSRPHTIIGSFLSIVSLFLITSAVAFPGISPDTLMGYLPVLWPTLVSALACNVYITGLNQLQDIEIDKINKPWLPIASGKLSVKQARVIIILCGIIALVSAALTNHVLLLLIGVIMLVGTAYSMPPLKFKRHHLAAAASILFVRGVLVNVGMPVHFLYAFSGKIDIPPDVWPLTFFVVGFSLAIAWFKDIPDTGGDKAFKINTLALSLSPRAAFGYGVAVVSVSYIGLLVLAAFLHLRVNQLFFFTSHAVLMLLFLAGASRVQLNDPKKLKIFYLVFWGFFFAEYVVYSLSYFLH